MERTPRGPQMESESSTRRESAAGNGGQVQEGRRESRANRTEGQIAGRESGAPTGPQRGRGLSYRTRDPLSMFDQLSQEVDQLWESFFGRRFGPRLRARREDEWQAPTLWTPSIDVRQREDSLEVCADLPGVRKEDVQIEVQDDVLTISGQRTEERDERPDQRGYGFVERQYGTFYRSIPLPGSVDPDSVKASMRDGVLKVSVPLPRSVQRRRIDIRD
jgi:HSP20 family protein